MDGVIEFFKSLYSSQGLSHLISSGGIWLLLAIVFSETGLLVGFFLPGDSLLVTAGVLAATTGADGHALLNIHELAIGLPIAAFLGDQINYFMGRRAGLAVFKRDDSRFFKKKYAEEAHRFYLSHGGKAIILARFIPILRTFVPFIAGVAEMPYRRYVVFCAIGAVSWINSMIWIGYLVGQTSFGKKLHYVILLVIFISFLPLIFGALNRFLSLKRAPKAVPAPAADSAEVK